MRGQVLGVDLASGDGQISGDDGQRYAFRPDDWADRVGPSVGALIDFEVEGRRALRIYRQPGTYQPGPAVVRPDRNRFVAAILAFLFGIFGAHQFYTGRTGTGVLMLLLTCTIVGGIVTGIWSFVDTARFLFMSDAEFDALYRRPYA